MARAIDPPIRPRPSSAIRDRLSPSTVGLEGWTTIEVRARPGRSRRRRATASTRLRGNPTVPTARSKPIRVLLVDDHRLVTGPLAQILAREPDIAVVGVAASVAEAKELARERLDVVLMDYRLPDGTGVEATRAIKARWPAARVIMVTAAQDERRSSSRSRPAPTAT
jgi:CheY-like chemotaxis protein